MGIETVGIELPAKGQPGRSSYTVRLRCAGDTVEAEFAIKVPVIRPRYKKHMTQVDEIARQARSELDAFLKRLLAKPAP
jgi:hypothetical protein